MDRNGRDEQKTSEYELRLLLSFFPEILKEAMIQVEKKGVNKMAVALYARVSTAKQAEKGLFIPDQLRQMCDWSKVQSHSVGME